MKTLEPTGRRTEPRAVAWLQVAQIGATAVLALVVGLTGYVVADRVQAVLDYQRVVRLDAAQAEDAKLLRELTEAGLEKDRAICERRMAWRQAQIDAIDRRRPDWVPPK
jgi:hypothetical protein